MAHVKYESYANPHPPPLRDEIRDCIYSHRPNIGWSNHAESLGEHVLGSVDVDETWPEAVSQWHVEASQWIPPTVFEWWTDQFNENGTLHTMAPQWWQYRAHRFIAALIDDMPIGGVALTAVHFGDRGIDPITTDRKHLFYEARGLVVAPSYRRTPTKIGTHLMSTLIHEASQAGETPAFAITNNPNAASIFAATGASNECDHPLFKHLTSTVLQGVVCWCAPRADPLCGECPLRPGQLWWWPANQE